MIRACASGRLMRAAACLLAALIVSLAANMASFDGALAQDSVRPPEGAVQGGTPTGGNVPGDALGNTSDSEMWRAVRKGVRGTVSISDQNAAQLVQSEGDNWRAFRNGPLVRWGTYVLAGMVVVLALFYLLRGRIRIDHGLSGRTVTRFGFVERTAHWLLAVSFIILGLTGLNITYGKIVLLPVLGKNAFAAITLWGKYLHNYVAFAFMAGLVMILVLWVADNFPNKYDAKWLVKGGGLFTKGVHPPSKKFNAGQKILFWLVILGGLSLVLSGIDLLFPFEFAMFSKTFAFLDLFGAGLPTDLAPVQEMQLATIWHAAVAIFMVAVILAHIYIGTLGMEGAFDAMGTGEVDENWAKEHHSIWAQEVTKASGAKRGAPAKARPAPAE